MGLVDGKRGLVTGAGRGIGQATATLLAAEGASVLVADIDPGSVDETTTLIRAAGGAAEPFVGDVSDEASVAEMVRTAVSAFGGLDFAHNNAVVGGSVKPLAEHTKDEWDRMIAVGLTGVFLCLKHEITAMLASGGGAIVNMASTAGLVAVEGIPAYVASKHGVVGLTKEAALDYSELGIRVNAVAPGWTETPAVKEALDAYPEAREEALASEPIGRLAAPTELAQAVMWLLSDRSSFVTGAVLPADGGYTAR